MYNPKLVGKCSLCDGPVVTSPTGTVSCMVCNAIGEADDVLYKSLPVIQMVRQTPSLALNGPSEYYYG